MTMMTDLGSLDVCVFFIGKMLEFTVPGTRMDEQATWANERKVVLTRGDKTATYEFELTLKFNALNCAAGIVSNWIKQCSSAG